MSMSWYDNAVFYHIYPLGLLGAPKRNAYVEPVHRLDELLSWIGHIRNLGCNALYIGPLFESVGHGYETTDYLRLDSRLGTNDDLTRFVSECHSQGVKVIFDAVFNHVGRDFFAFKDLQRNREESAYRDWFCDVDFAGDNEYGDGFSYGNWGGYNLLVKLNLRNAVVRGYLLDVVRTWVREFDVDGLRLDAADVLDFGFMRELRSLANEIKPEFWLMGEVIHGDYTRWANGEMLHSVTDYNLHKALYSAHNDHNYFEVAHTVKRLRDMGLNRPGTPLLYSFVDNHDVERICTKLRNKAHVVPAYILLYTLPGTPSVYYGSEFGIEGGKEAFSDDSLRPALALSDNEDALELNPLTRLIASLGNLRQSLPALSSGDYRELHLTCGHYAFERASSAQSVIVTVNNDAVPAHISVEAKAGACYMGALCGGSAIAVEGRLDITIPGNSGEIWVEGGAPEIAGAPVLEGRELADMFESKEHEIVGTSESETASEDQVGNSKTLVEPLLEDVCGDKPYEEMAVEELQAVILAKLARLGPVTDRMRREVADNVWRESLITWARSF